MDVTGAEVIAVDGYGRPALLRHSLGAGQTVNCTFVNRQRGKAQVIKTVQGAAPSGTHAFTFQLRQGATTTNVGTTLETQVANAANGGILNFNTLLVPGQTYQLCEIVMPAWLTSLGTFVPDSFNPPAPLSLPNVDGLEPGPDHRLEEEALGPRLERGWSAGEFTRSYVVCGLGGWFLHVLLVRESLLIGASAAVFGVMLVLYRTRIIKVTERFRTIVISVPSRSPIEALPRISDHLCAECRDHFAEVTRELSLLGIPYRLSHRLVRGLDYYVRTTFEVLGASPLVLSGQL